MRSVWSGLHCLLKHICQTFEWNTNVWYNDITETRLFKYTENFPTKNEKFQMKILIFSLFLLKNIDCG